MMPKSLTFMIALVIIVSGVFVYLKNASVVPPRNEIHYGVTYSVFRSNELGLDWKKVYDALFDELNVRKFRFVAHWELTEPENNVFDFYPLDYQIRRAEEENAKVILAIGRRLPSWPECHVPPWALALSPEEREQELLEYMSAIIDRYKDSPALLLWQVENEPFIIGFAIQNCGALDTDFLDKEIALVRKYDPNHPVLVTASGELGLWNNTWKRTDVFGTTLYRHVYNADLKSFITYPTTPGFFRAKRTFTEFTTGKKIPAIIAELGAEAWPIQRIVDTPIEEQLKRMNLERFNNIIEFAAKTSFSEQYLWGAEWWYYLKEVHHNDSLWNRARELF
ncbi:MAG: hypothetical protein AAB439_02995 [Patescibacteria group bacterium]